MKCDCFTTKHPNMCIPFNSNATHIVVEFYSPGQSGAAKDKQPLKKAQTPQGRLDTPEEKNPEAPQSKTIRGQYRTFRDIVPLSGSSFWSSSSTNKPTCNSIGLNWFLRMYQCTMLIEIFSLTKDSPMT